MKLQNKLIRTTKLNSVGTPTRNGVHLELASSTIPENHDWLWIEWLAAGGIHILGGSPGTGKITFAIDIAAAISNNKSEYSR